MDKKPKQMNTFEKYFRSGQMTSPLDFGPLTSDFEPYFLITTRLGFQRWREDDLPLALGLCGDYEVTKLIDGRGRLTTNQVQERLIKEIATDLLFAK